MRTQLIDINPDTWTEITDGALTSIIQPRISGVLLLHFSNSLTPPEDSEYHCFQNYKGPLFLSELGLVAGQRIWAKTTDGACQVAVTRDVIGFEALQDSADNPLIDRNDLVLQAQEAV